MPFDLRPCLPPLRCAVRAGADEIRALGDHPLTLVLLVGETPAPSHEGLVAALGGDLHAVLGAYGPPAMGSATKVPLPGGLLVMAGAGDGGPTPVRRAAAVAARASTADRTLLLGLTSGQDVCAAVEGVLLGSVTPPTWTASGPSSRPGIREIVILGAADGTGVSGAADGAGLGGAADGAGVGGSDGSAGTGGVAALTVEVERARVRANATLLARNLANAPSNLKNPVTLAGETPAATRSAKATTRSASATDRALGPSWIRDLTAGCGVSVKTWDERALAREGFGGLLAVGAGSATPPRLVELTYAPRGADPRPIVLVGKGITFDTGGLNVKGAAGMLTMKTDMSGAAIVLAVLTACRALGIKRRVVGLLPLAENAIGASSYRPSDVITHFGGTTVEVGNTDAEGRLVLADALAYAAARLDPVALVDIATLTGHARIALADAMAPSYGSDATLHTALVCAFAEEGEPLWPMPLVEDYRASLASEVADLSHIGPLGGLNAGSILAALFLREFVGQAPWVHIDIAGTGRSDSDTGLLSVGATGYGARGLLRWLEGA